MKHMIDKEQLEMMKPTAYLINASRGPVVHEAALADALEDKVIEGAALDVFEFEPEINDKLKTLDNVVITPHIGNATFEARDMMADIVTQNIFKSLMTRHLNILSTNRPIIFVLHLKNVQFSKTLLTVRSLIFIIISGNTFYQLLLSI